MAVGSDKEGIVGSTGPGSGGGHHHHDSNNKTTTYRRKEYGHSRHSGDATASFVVVVVVSADSTTKKFCCMWFVSPHGCLAGYLFSSHGDSGTLSKEMTCHSHHFWSGTRWVARLSQSMRILLPYHWSGTVPTRG